MTVKVPLPIDILLGRIEIHRARGEQEIAELLSARLRRCPRCGNLVRSPKPNAVYCSESCRKSAAEARSRAKRNIKDYQRDYYLRHRAALIESNRRRYRERREVRLAQMRLKYATDPDYRLRAIERARARSRKEAAT